MLKINTVTVIGATGTMGANVSESSLSLVIQKYIVLEEILKRLRIRFHVL